MNGKVVQISKLEELLRYDAGNARYGRKSAPREASQNRGKLKVSAVRTWKRPAFQGVEGSSVSPVGKAANWHTVTIRDFTILFTLENVPRNSREHGQALSEKCRQRVLGKLQM